MRGRATFAAERMSKTLLIGAHLSEENGEIFFGELQGMC
jgi:hypothetical protein